MRGRENVAPAPAGAAAVRPADPIDSAAGRRKLERARSGSTPIAGREEPAVVSVTATLAASHQAIEIFRGDGEHRTDLRPLVRLNVSVVVERDGRRETAGHGGGGRFGLDRLLDDQLVARQSPTRRCARPGSGSRRSRRQPAR